MFHFKKVQRQLAVLTLWLSIFPLALHAADNVSVLGSKPKWSVLEKYQETITHDEFTRLIQNVYCTHGFAPDLIEINEKTARVLMNRERSEERRVGKECRSRWAAEHQKQKRKK